MHLQLETKSIQEPSTTSISTSCFPSFTVCLSLEQYFSILCRFTTPNNPVPCPPTANPISSNVYENNFAKQKTMTKINRGHNIFFFYGFIGGLASQKECAMCEVFYYMVHSLYICMSYNNTVRYVTVCILFYLLRRHSD